MSKEQDGLSDPTAGQQPVDAAAGSALDPAAEPASGALAGSEPVGVDSQEQLRVMEQQVRRTRISATWVAIVVAIVVLVLLLIFILENLRTVTVTYFGASGQLPLGVALLFAAIGGALLVSIIGMARLTQLRLNARRRRRVSTRARNESSR